MFQILFLFLFILIQFLIHALHLLQPHFVWLLLQRGVMHGSDHARVSEHLAGMEWPRASRFRLISYLVVLTGNRMIHWLRDYVIPKERIIRGQTSFRLGARKNVNQICG